MDLNTRASQTKRFVIEDSYTKVTADGEPHEMMTLIAGLSGVLAAVIILIVLISLVACKKEKSNKRGCKKCPGDSSSSSSEDGGSRPISIISSEAQRSSISTIYTRITSISESIPNSPTIEPTTDFEISRGNLQGNLNAAFEENELYLADSLNKMKKKTRWLDEVANNTLAKETVIDMR